jgi:H+/gluconate symporter-like permease
VSHELRNLANQPHETLTRILIGAAVAIVAVLGGVGYLRWRERKRKPGDKAAIKRRRKSRDGRRR